MLKRTKGQLLITLLVVTGLAGTMNNNSLTYPERKMALSFLKDGKNDVLKSVSGMTEKQMNFKFPSKENSIKNLLQQLALTEQKMWSNVISTIKQSANPEKRLEINYTDNQLISLTETNKGITNSSATFKQANVIWKTGSSSLHAFKNMRIDHIKYMKTSTEDLRNHVINTQAGWIDCYQYILIMAAETQRIADEIKLLKANAAFPKK